VNKTALYSCIAVHLNIKFVCFKRNHAVNAILSFTTTSTRWRAIFSASLILRF